MRLNSELLPAFARPMIATVGSFVAIVRYIITEATRTCEYKYGQLFFAKFQGQIVAGAFALCLEKKSTYKDGASVRVRKAYGASHLLQWRVIQWARKRGVTTHDLCGAPPSDRIHDKTHFLHGVGQFKTSFSKKVTDYVGAFDLVINARKYSVWRSLAERLLLRFYRNILRKNWY
jgi:lipid II:glycine glycyltransferase (peptidoglycan interpeptide bridge formation enzyme)